MFMSSPVRYDTPGMPTMISVVNAIATRGLVRKGAAKAVTKQKPTPLYGSTRCMTRPPATVVSNSQALRRVDRPASAHTHAARGAAASGRTSRAAAAVGRVSTRKTGP
ncbi:hypothetical protein [Nonomuraea sp. NPDC049607]|uniref:hypothetical protein n=1 Tax=Nonomuraea sp. NPDC049607 TaxID=3154732 RepID=UPI00341F9F9D